MGAMNTSDLNQPAAKDETAPRQSIEELIIGLCAAQGQGSTISPTHAAKTVALAKHNGDDSAWRGWLPRVRAAAIGMARKGDLVIYRKGKPADPDDFRGVYRLGLPPPE